MLAQLRYELVAEPGAVAWRDIAKRRQEAEEEQLHLARMLLKLIDANAKWAAAFSVQKFGCQYRPCGVRLSQRYHDIAKDSNTYGTDFPPANAG